MTPPAPARPPFGEDSPFAVLARYHALIVQNCDPTQEGCDTIANVADPDNELYIQAEVSDTARELGLTPLDEEEGEILSLLVDLEQRYCRLLQTRRTLTPAQPKEDTK